MRPTNRSRLGTLLLLSAATLLAAPLAAPAEAQAKARDLEWQVTAGGKPAGVERLKIVVSSSGTTFSSGEVVPPGKKAVRVKTHQQRDANGLHKYRRENDVRLGKGVFAFRKGATVRIVGVNDSKAKPVELGSPSLLVWDDAALHCLHAWVKHLGAVSAETEVSYLDVDARAIKKAKLTPVGDGTLYAADAEEKPVKRVTVAGPKAEAIELWVSTGGDLLGIQTGSSKLLKKGLAWTAEASPKTEVPVTPAVSAQEGAEPTEDPGAGP